MVFAGRLAAEVDVNILPNDDAWGPYLSLDDVRKLERVHEALERGDITAAAREARVYELTPIAAE